MFTVHCPDHDTMVLLGTRSIEDLHVTTNGIHLMYRCSCGHRGTWQTGRLHTRNDSALDETKS